MPGRGASPLRAFLAVAALSPLVGGGCAPRPSIGGDAASEAAAVAERLPAVAAGFRRVATRPAAAGSGREVLYATDGGRETAAAAVELLPGHAGGAEAALESALAEALSAGPARDMREAGRFAVAPAGGAGPPLLCAETAGRYGRERVAGLVCAGRAGAAGVVRLRVTMPAREPPPADPRAFAEAIAAALASGPAAAG